MPERLPTAKPQIMAGTSLRSGDPNTGQILMTTGGGRAHTVYSGTAGGDANIVVGGGRVDKGILFHSIIPVLSGVPVILYDSAVATSGGPFAASGHKIVGILQHPPVHGNSNVSGVFESTRHLAALLDLGGIPFTSGLCHTGTSGQPGFTVSFTTVISG